MALDFGMPTGFAQALATKYALLRQQANAQTKTANADANLTDVKAGLMPAESAATVGLTNAQARNTDETTKFIGPLAHANIFNTMEQGGLFHQQAVGEGQLNKVSKGLFGKPGGMPTADDAFGDKLKSILKEGLGY